MNNTDLNDLFIRNYEATKRRGLITSKTQIDDFLIKLAEEVKEVNLSYDFEAGYIDPMELVDVMLVCASTLIYMGKNPLQEIKKKTIINEKRVETNRLDASKIVLRMFRNGEPFESDIIINAIDSVLTALNKKP